MSHIEDLVARLCPDGVEYKKVCEIAEVGTGNSDRKDAVKDGKYPFYVRSQDIIQIDSFQFDEEAIVIPGEGGIGTIFHYVSGKYALHQRAYRIHFTTPDLLTRFAYYYFSCRFKSFILTRAVNATVSSIRKPMITDFPVPVPPLEIQREIVRILDSFSKLEAELEAELEARRQQYAHYRDHLLTFTERERERENKSGGRPWVRFARLSHLAARRCRHDEITMVAQFLGCAHKKFASWMCTTPTLGYLSEQLMNQPQSGFRQIASSSQSQALQQEEAQ